MAVVHNPGCDVYIAYSGKEADVAGRLTDALRKRGWTVFFRREIVAGEDWRAAENAALEGSRFVVLLMSEASFSRRGLESEWRLSLEREQKESRVVLIPLRLGDCPVPEALRQKAWVDFADAADGKDFDRCVDELDRALRHHSGAPLPLALPTLAVPDDLAKSCSSGECVLFAGAGLSAGAGVAPWTTFLFDLLHHVEEQKMIDTDYARSFEAALREGERNSVADGIVQIFGNRRKPLQEFLLQYYPDLPISSAHRLLQSIPFSSIITTNYDRLLEETFPEHARQGLFTTRDAERLLDALSQKTPFILKLYGLIERLETLVFAPIEYREVLSSNVSFSKFMEGIFFSRTFFFIGLSLEGIQDFLSGFVFRGVSTRKHFALVAVTGSAWKARADLLLRRYNIEVIPFPVSPEFPEMETFLKELRVKSAPVYEGGLPESAAVPIAPGIRRVVLENIGPFEKLEVDFQREHNWKVLLGDNGVGKSTILKAIAVAIMGGDARSFAGRLVRTGQTKGRITLCTESNPQGYITDIMTKDVLSEAEVVSLPTRPMEAERWLALGFSPLRVVTWSPSSGPQSMIQKGRPTADDLLPIVSGETDPRMDRLKQWIVNLDSAERIVPTRVLSGHARPVKSVVFTPDGRSLVSGSIDSTIRMWDAWTGAETLKIVAHSGGVNSTALSGDGNIIASGSFDRFAKTWQISGEPSRKFAGSRSQILSVALDNDGSTLVTGSESGSIRIWNAFGETLIRWTGKGGAVWCVALSPDGSILASGTYGGIVNLNSVPDGRPIRSIEVKRGTVMALAWSQPGSARGKELLCASRNGPVHVLDPETGAVLREFASSDTTSAAISKDGRVVAAGSANGEVIAWDAESGTELMRERAHSQTVWSVALSPDGRTLASASEDATIRLWSLPGSMPSGTYRETIRRFFKLLGELTDRPDIRFLGVTSDFRVMVRTSQSKSGVPVELLSQGMSSLFGWVGVLCQRLKETLETTAEDPLPTGSYALVLIDELDAHMHPAWQRVLVHRLSKVFPRVQFIATTHSPLIVADLPPESIFVLRRKDEDEDNSDEEDGAIVCGSPEEARDIRGLRVDQILLSPVFGLDGVRGEGVDEKQKKYLDLALKLNRSPEEEAVFGRLAEELEHYRVTPEETREAREAARLIEERLDQKIEGLDREKLIEEIRAQMLELETPFRRESVRPKS